MVVQLIAIFMVDDKAFGDWAIEMLVYNTVGHDRAGLVPEGDADYKIAACALGGDAGLRESLPSEMFLRATPSDSMPKDLTIGEDGEVAAGDVGLKFGFC